MALGPAADNETWEKCKTKGEFLCAFMKADDEAAGKRLEPPQDSAASRFNNFPELFKTLGWWQGQDDKTTFTEGGYGLEWAFRNLGISKEKEDWTFCKVVHGDQRENAPKSYEESYNVVGKSYRVGISTNIQCLLTKPGHWCILHGSYQRQERCHHRREAIQPRIQGCQSHSSRHGAPRT